jgi:hypothetical protein
LSNYGYHVKHGVTFEFMGGERLDFLDKRDFFEPRDSGETTGMGGGQRRAIIATSATEVFVGLAPTQEVGIFFRVGLVILGGKLQWIHGMYPS